MTYRYETVKNYLRTPLNAALPKDLYGATGHSIAGERALLVDPEQSDRRCMVQMFSHDGEGYFAITPVYSRKEQKDLHYKNLTFTTKGAHQRFRTLIYPHREGAPMPVVKGSGNSFTITIGDQVDELVVSRDAKGGPQVKMRRK